MVLRGLVGDRVFCLAFPGEGVSNRGTIVDIKKSESSQTNSVNEYYFSPINRENVEKIGFDFLEKTYSLGIHALYIQSSHW